MITDNETNFVYLAHSLRSISDYIPFCERLCAIFDNNNISFDFIMGTKDIWCCDYMPIQIENNNFIQFKYDPDFLRYDRLWRETIPNECDYRAIYKSINEDFQPKCSQLLLDGGNVIKGEF